jgi:hypothetical protein
MSLLFISHSSLDKEAANNLRHRLIGKGYSPDQIFLDSDRDSGIEPGADWERTLDNGLKRHRALIVLCSMNWEQSKWCFAELVHAKSQGKHVFPVVLENMELSGPISESQAVFPCKDGTSAYERLFESLENNHLGPTDDLGWPPRSGDDCPFPGLMAFDEELAAVYFGRGPERESVLQRLKQMRANGEPRLLMIVGASGSGKSSLLKAGVLPRLKHKTHISDWFLLPTLRFADASEDLNQSSRRSARRWKLPMQETAVGDVTSLCAAPNYV